MLGNLMTVLLACLVVVGLLLVMPAAHVAAAGRSLLSRLRPSSAGPRQGLQGATGLLILAGAVFILVAGVGAATSYLSDRPDVTSSSHADAGDDSVARLKSYTRSIAAEQSVPKAGTAEPLADVNTMIDRLAARLKSAPDDAKGWRMLGWSYFHTGRFQEAVPALARAIELDPSSDELKRAYDDAKAKVGAGDAGAGDAPEKSSPSKSAAKSADGPSAEQITAYQAMPPQDREAAIRGMVDGLAQRLESSPRDVEGWTRLMRSRVVLGEKEGAATAFRRALDVFKDDTAASSRIAAAATELGLKAE